MLRSLREREREKKSKHSCSPWGLQVVKEGVPLSWGSSGESLITHDADVGLRSSEGVRWCRAKGNAEQSNVVTRLTWWWKQTKKIKKNSLSATYFGKWPKNRPCLLFFIHLIHQGTKGGGTWYIVLELPIRQWYASSIVVVWTVLFMLSFLRPLNQSILWKISPVQWGCF